MNCAHISDPFLAHIISSLHLFDALQKRIVRITERRTHLHVVYLLNNTSLLYIL